MRADFSTADPGRVGAVLDGAWLRRERERIAIGRRQVADRLGLPESQVIRVEINQRPVPPDWFVALAELGFPVPAEVVPANAKAETATADSATFQAVADVPPPVEPASVAEVADSAAISPAVDQLAIEEVSPSLLKPEPAPEAAPEPSIAAPASAAPAIAPSTDPTPAPSAAPSPARVPAESPRLDELPSAEPTPSPTTAPSDTIGMKESPTMASPPGSPRRRSVAAVPQPTPLRGRWLRAQRQTCDISAKRLCHALAIPKTSLPHLERNDIPIPTDWLPKLAELGLLPAGSSDILSAAPPAAVRYTGRWLRRERKKRGMLHIAIAPALPIACASLEIIEARDWPLPPEWLPILRRLGLPVSEVAAALAPQDVPRPDAEPKPPGRRVVRVVLKSRGKRADQNKTSLPKKAAPAQPSVEHTTRQAPSTAIDGRWLQGERERLGLSAAVLYRHLHVSSRTYMRFERPRVRVPRSWWPALRELRLNLPVVPPAPPSKSARHRGPLDGAWLARERRRLRLTEYEVCRALQANARMLRRVERDAAELPKAWLAKLPVLGITIEGISTRRGQTQKGTNSATPPASAAPSSKPSKKTKTAPTAAALEPATTPRLAPTASEGADLAALIVQYRVSFGRRAKQPAFEILRRILTDLSESGLDGTITDEDVERAAQVLIHRR